MRRFSSIILSILLGAVAVAVGMGIFLHLANTDRARLAEIALKAQRDSQTAIQARESAVKDANAKLASAESEVKKTQEQLKALQDERDLMMEAQVLLPPTPKELRTWKETITLPLGVSIKVPPRNTTDLSDANRVSLIATTPNVATSSDTLIAIQDVDRWFTLLPYDASTEQRELQNLSTTSTSIDFLVNGHVIVGRKGLDASGRETLVAHIQSEGVKDFVLLAHTIPGKITYQTILSTLGTLNFSN